MQAVVATTAVRQIAGESDPGAACSGCHRSFVSVCVAARVYGMGCGGAVMVVAGFVVAVTRTGVLRAVSVRVRISIS